MVSSAIPGAVSYFIQLATTTLPPEYLVWFGKELGVFTAPVTLQILNIVGNQDPAELGPNYRREETFSIHCDLTSYMGDLDFQSRMTEVMNAFALLQVAIGNDYTLGGNVRFAEVGDFDFTPDADAKGQSTGSLVFAVRCSQRVTSLT